MADHSYSYIYVLFTCLLINYVNHPHLSCMWHSRARRVSLGQYIRKSKTSWPRAVHGGLPRTPSRRSEYTTDDDRRHRTDKTRKLCATSYTNKDKSARDNIT